MPGVRPTLPRTDEGCVRVGNLHCFCNLANFFSSEQWLNSLNVEFLSQPTRQTSRVPPRIRDGVIAQQSRNTCLLFLTFWLHVAEGSNVRHNPSRFFSCTLSAVATGNTFNTTHSTDFRVPKGDCVTHRESVSPAFALATPSESRRKYLFAPCRTAGRIPEGLRHPFGDRCHQPTPRVCSLAELLS